jgi:Uma2 family endonuclease
MAINDVETFALGHVRGIVCERGENLCSSGSETCYNSLMHAPADKPIAVEPSFGTPRVKTQWTYDEYYRMAELGIFQNKRVELIEGEIIEMRPQSESHFGTIMLVVRQLEKAFGEGYAVRPQGPVRTREDEEPEPDIAVVAGDIREIIAQGHPRSAILIVEVSVGTLAFDLGKKAEIYAASGVEDYWVLDVVNRLLHVYRQTIPDTSLPRGRRYSHINVLDAKAAVTPLGAPQSSIRVADLLP